MVCSAAANPPSAPKMCLRITRRNGNLLAVVMCISLVFLWMFSGDIQSRGHRWPRYHAVSLSSQRFSEDQNSPPPNSPPPRWTPVQNKSEYVGEMASETLPFLMPHSPEAKELLDMNVNCSQPWMTIPRSGQLGANAMQTVFMYNFKFKYKVQIGMVEETWEMVHPVFPYANIQLLPPECRQQIEEENLELLRPGEILKELAKENGQRHFLVKPSYHNVVDMWYLRKVLIEDFRIADHFVTEAREVLDSLLLRWSQQMGNIQPTTVVGVHARRCSDKLTEVEKYFNSSLPPAAYYNLALATARRMFGVVAFVAITDDLKWVHQYLLTAHQDVVMQDHIRSRGVDLAVLAMCDHVIYSVGNFGLLGAWLAGGKIFYPDGTYTGYEKPINVQREKEVRTYHHFIPIRYNHTENFCPSGPSYQG